MRSLLDTTGIPWMEQMLADGSIERLHPSNIARILDFLGKYGMGEPTKLSNPEFAAIVGEIAAPYFKDRKEDFERFCKEVATRAGQ